MPQLKLECSPLEQRRTLVPRQSKHFTPQEKVSILRRHLPDKVPASTICEEAGIQPSVDLCEIPWPELRERPVPSAFGDADPDAGVT